MRILVIEDDRKVANFVQTGLEQEEDGKQPCCGIDSREVHRVVHRAVPEPQRAQEER